MENSAVAPEVVTTGDGRSAGGLPMADTRLTWTRTSAACLVVVIVAAACSLWLRATVPIRPISFADGFFDDGLFARSAVSLAARNWLGEIDIVTLAKGPGYPLFIAATHQIGIPLKVGEQITYLLGVALVALAYLLIRRQPISAAVVFVVLAFDPAMFSARAASVGRDYWYAGVTLLFLGASFLTVLFLARGYRMVASVPMAIVAGASGGAFWLCREEGVWIVPSIGLTLVGVPLLEWLNRRRSTRSATAGQAADDPTRPERAAPKGWRRFERIARPIAVSLVAVAAFVIPINIVTAKNEKVYGVALISDLSAGAFPQAYGAWSRVRGVPLHDYVPIGREQREAVYEVSSAARELRPWLEDPGNPWNQGACAQLDVCGDYAGGWMPWVMRIGADLTGHFDTESDFQEFFGRLADEINAACDDGRLTCAPALPASLQPVLRASVAATVASAIGWFPRLVSDPSYFALQTDPNFGNLPDEDRALMLTGISGIPADVGEASADRDSFLRVEWLYKLLGALYVPLYWVLIGLCVLSAVLAASGRATGHRTAWVGMLGGALLLGVVSRLLLFGVLDTTQYLADPVYHVVTRILLLSAAVLGAMVAVEALTRCYRGFGWPPRKTGRILARSAAGPPAA